MGGERGGGWWLGEQRIYVYEYLYLVDVRIPLVFTLLQETYWKTKYFEIFKKFLFNFCWFKFLILVSSFPDENRSNYYDEKTYIDDHQNKDRYVQQEPVHKYKDRYVQQ